MHLDDIPIIYKTSARARRMRITIREGIVIATRPVRAPERLLINFVQSKLDWIRRVLQRNAGRPSAAPQMRHTKAQYAAHRKQAKTLVVEKLAHFNKFYNFEYKKIFIKNQATRWGSCSARGNLNFNYKILFLTPRLQDYLIVHELCHLREMNHGPRFWALVAQQIPDYKKCSKELRLGTLE